MSNLCWLSDAQMERIKPFFPTSHGNPRVDDRRVLIGIIFFNLNGLRWRGAPKEYGPPKTLYNRWKRWSDNVPAGHAAVADIARDRDAVVCFESTGGQEWQLWADLEAEGVAARQVPPAQVKAFAKMPRPSRAGATSQRSWDWPCSSWKLIPRIKC